MQVVVCGSWPDVVKYLSGVVYGLVWEQFSCNNSNYDAIKTDADKIALVRQAFDGFSRRGSIGNCGCFDDGNDDSWCNGHSTKYTDSFGDGVSHFHSDCITYCQWSQDHK
jgi:hypothetical protein